MRTTEPLFLAALMVVAGTSAVVVKELMARSGTLSGETELAAVATNSTAQSDATIADPLADAAPVGTDADAIDATEAPEATGAQAEPGPELVQAPVAPQMTPAEATVAQVAPDLTMRWFNGRPVRPARTMTMLVTAYAPCERSCAGTADGITASLHRVETNGHALVAADTRVLPLGSIISVPGYDEGRIVPVLDRGGKIKGRRLDVLFPTHEQAVKFGVRRVTVTVWAYADGQPAGNWRAIRDGR
jgi:3D (Asp-Asp-Asp) domain-containing protein